MFKPYAIKNTLLPAMIFVRSLARDSMIYSSFALFHLVTTTGSDVCQYVVTANNTYWPMVVNLSFGNANSIVPGDDARRRNILP